MKKKMRIFLIVAVFIIVIVSLILFFKTQYNMYVLSSSVCRIAVGVTPDNFIENQGNNTYLSNGYTYAKIDKNGNLILIVTNEEKEAWKNSHFALQILATVWEGKNIGVEVDAVQQESNDSLAQFRKFYFDAAVASGLELSEDYTQVVAESGDDTFYYSWFMRMGITMQMFEGVPSEDIRVEYIEYDANGEIVNREVWPDDFHNEIISTTK